MIKCMDLGRLPQSQARLLKGNSRMMEKLIDKRLKLKIIIEYLFNII